MTDTLLIWQQALQSGVILGGAVILALIVHRILFSVVLERMSRMNEALHSFVSHAQGPALLLLPLLALLLVLPAIPLLPEARSLTDHIIELGLIGSVGWLAMRLTNVAGELLVLRYEDPGANDREYRELRTRVQVLRRVAAIVLGFITFGLMLMTFPSLQTLGASLLASAGFAGLAVGMAARPALQNLIAGLQIALTQPIRINDVVIVEGEWGWIEEISATFVVVRVWDLRRLVIPLSKFIEEPFQNWTRITADLLGTVFIYTDYSVPVEEIREELHRILQTSPLWDGKVWGLQVTDAKEQTMELRALMSTEDSSKGWDLRCYVREKLIEYLRDRHPQSLPRVRAEFSDGVPQIRSVGQSTG